MEKTLTTLTILVWGLLTTSCADVPETETEAPSEEAADAGPQDKQSGSLGYPTKTPSIADYALLPFAVELRPEVPAGWQTNSSSWLYPLESVWPRTGRGSWYRARNYSTLSLFRTGILPVPYVCTPDFLAFRCAGYGPDGRRQEAYVSCPWTVRGSPRPATWRSGYNPYDSQGKWFAWNGRAPLHWRFFADRIERSLAGMGTTDGGRQVNCSYPMLAPDWPYLDVWLETNPGY
jgi:hypothetical protein